MTATPNHAACSQPRPTARLAVAKLGRYAAQSAHMTSEQTIKCNIAIHTAAAAAVGIGAGLAQIPGSDNVPLVAVQITMAVTLGNIFDVQISETAGRGMVMTALASMTGPVIARVVSQFLAGWIPGAGTP